MISSSLTTFVSFVFSRFDLAERRHLRRDIDCVWTTQTNDSEAPRPLGVDNATIVLILSCGNAN